jgi:Flp pilus assembly protein TadD
VTFSDQTRLGRRDAALAILLAALVFIVFARCLTCGFIHYDDPFYITENRVVQEGLSLRGFGWAFTTGHAANWHPVTWLSHMLDVELFGLEPWGHHLTNVLLHALCAALLYVFLKNATGSRWRSLAVAALFAIHPLRVESVAWVSERKDVLSTAFGLGVFIAYVSYARRGGIARYLLVAVLLSLGLMAKPMLVTWPVLMLLLDIWPLRRIRWEGWRALPGRRAAALVFEKLPLLLLCAASAVVTVLVQRAGGAVANLGYIPLEARLANAPRAAILYLWKTLWPVDLAPFYPHPGADAVGWAALAAVLTLLALTAGAVVAVRRWPWLLTGWLWYIIALAPVIGIVQVGQQAMADRYTYVPMIGVYIAIVFSIPSLAWRPALRRTAWAGAAVLLILLAGMTWRQIGFWRDTEQLFTHTLAAAGENPVARKALGALRVREGRLAEAEEHYLRLMKIAPEDPDVLFSLATVYDLRGDMDEAVRLFEEATRQFPGDSRNYASLGVIALKQGNLVRAEALFEQALQMNDEDALALMNLATIEGRRGQTGRALNMLERAYAIAPETPSLPFNLGYALLMSGQTAEAVPRLREAVQRRPQNANAHTLLGLALNAAGRKDEAIPALEQALRLNPNQPDARLALEQLKSSEGVQ